MEVLGRKQPSGTTTPIKLRPSTTIAHAHWMNMYGSRPAGTHELFELEAIIAKRMELLAWIDMQLSSQKSGNLTDVLKKISNRLPTATGPSTPVRPSTNAATLGSDVEDTPSAGKHPAFSEREIVSLSDDEDLMSHLLCRFAFCMNDKWRKWFIRVEEILLRAKYVALRDRAGPAMIATLLTQNGLPCEPVTEENAPPKLAQYIELLKARSGSAQANFTAADFVSVPLGLATRLVRDRQVLMHRGSAILQYSQAHEVFLAVYRTQLARGLHDAFQLRNKNDAVAGDEDPNSSLMLMLDAFLSRFVAEPQDHLKEMTSGVVRHQDVAALAQTHFPLCMRRVDVAMREQAHLRHNGRLMYGLFLKAIGLSMEDSMQLFSNVMTVKGGGSVEAFAKSSYGYNVRYNYGKEGKKTNYSSFSCATVIGLPPMTGGADCHGCPFHFRDEGALRQALAKEYPNPYGPELPKVKAMPSAIEEIVQDAKDQHYTRACYKYFMATHTDAKRDSLFRSPFEYHVYSLESKLQREKEAQQHLHQAEGAPRPSDGGSGVKRSPAPFLREGSTRHRTEE